MFKFECGLEVVTKIRKFKGIITARASHLHGCNRYYVEPKVDKDGKIPDGYWFDEDDLEVKGKGLASRKPTKRTGGFASREK